MVDFKELVNEKMSELIDGGFIAQKIDEELRKCIGSVIHNTLRAYSDFGNSLNDAIKSNIGTFQGTLDSYNDHVSQLAAQIYGEQLNASAIPQLEAAIKRNMPKAPPTKVTLESIIGLFEEHWGPDFLEQGESEMKYSVIREDNALKLVFMTWYGSGMELHLYREYDRDHYHLTFIRNTSGSPVTKSAKDRAATHVSKLDEILLEYYFHGTQIEDELEFEGDCVLYLSQD